MNSLKLYYHKSMIKFQNVSKQFSSDIFKKAFTALSEVSFEIEEGKIIGFLGANGAGKTTSLKILMDFIRPSSGEVFFNPKMGKNKKEIFSNIGFLPERPYFYPHLKGIEFCDYMGKLCGLKKNIIRERTHSLAKDFKIDFALEREVKTYSKGMLQRLGFLTALLHDPKVVILDEPLSGVDPIGRKELKDVILEVNKRGKTVFFSSHIVSDVEEVCDTVVFLKNGELSYNGSVDKIIQENIKPNTTIFYMRNDEKKKEIVENAISEKRIVEIIKEGAKIISVSQEKPSLEEIFYQVDNDKF